MIKTIASFLAVSVLMTGSAFAGPTPEQPSTKAVSKTMAHKAAKYVVKNYFAETLVGPTKVHVQKCAGKPMLRICPAVVRGGDTTCRTKLAVWADDNAFYVEYRKLRCR